MKRLTHLDRQGHAQMVDVGNKQPGARRAVASALVVMGAETRRLVLALDLPKGDALAVARLAGIQGAKLTATLIPLCHPLPLDHLAVELKPHPDGIRIFALARTRAATGVEMEAMTGASVAALALVDMVKGVEREVSIRDIRLELKEGGTSGRWVRADHEDPWSDPPLSTPEAP